MDRDDTLDMFSLGDVPSAQLPPWHRNAAETSREAAISMRSEAARQSKLVLDYIKAQGARGATADEVAEALGLGPQSVTPRIWQLEGKDKRNRLQPMIRRTEARRPTRSGRAARVYVAL